MARQLSSSTELNATLPAATGTGGLTMAARIYSDTASTAGYPDSVDRWLTLGGIGGSESVVLRREWTGSTHGDCYVNGTAGGRVQAGTVVAGTWEAWGVTIDGSTIRLYKDGSQVGSVAQTQAITSETILTTGRDDTEGFDGRFAEIGIWTRALTDDEMKALALGFRPAFFANGLLECWPLVGGGLVGLRGSVLVDSVSSTAGDHPSVYCPVRAGAVVVPAAGGTIYTQTVGLAARASAFVPVGANVLTGSVTLAARGGLVDAGANAFDRTIAVDARGQLAQTGQVAIPGVVGLLASASVTGSPQQAVTQTVALAARAALSPSAVAAFLGLVPLAGAATLTPSGVLVLAIAQALTAQASLLASGSIGSSTIAELVGLASRAAMGLTLDQAMAHSVSVAAAARLTPSGQAVLTAVTGLVARTDLHAFNAAALTEILTAQLRADISAASQQAMTAILALGGRADVAEAAALSLQASLTLGVAALLLQVGTVPTGPVLDALVFTAERIVADLQFTQERIVSDLTFTQERFLPES